jgi:hypothetical protein
MRGLLFIAFVVTGMTVSAGVNALVQYEELPVEDVIILNKRDVYESCFQMNEGETLSYSFQAGLKLAFNIHYHLGEKSDADKTVNLVDVALSRAEKGEIEIPVSNEICMMWTNGSFRESARLVYEAKIRD